MVDAWHIFKFQFVNLNSLEMLQMSNVAFFSESPMGVPLSNLVESHLHLVVAALLPALGDLDF